MSSEIDCALHLADRTSRNLIGEAPMFADPHAVTLDAMSDRSAFVFYFMLDNGFRMPLIFMDPEVKVSRTELTLSAKRAALLE